MTTQRRLHSISLLLFLVCVWLCFDEAAALPNWPTPAQDDTTDYYAVLGLEAKREDATEREVKSAWRKLSKAHHPDVSGDGARERYQVIQRAYEVLGDRRKRKVYDILGEEGLKQLESPQQPQQESNWIFQAFGMPGGAANTGPNMEVVLFVSLEDIYSGAAHTLKFKKTKVCRACKGSGAKSPQHIHPCSVCRGRGAVVQNVQIAPGFITRMEQPCSRCSGTGKVVTTRCGVCSGRKIVSGFSKISVDVEAGTSEGQSIVFELEADQQPGQVPGDVHVLVLSEPHSRFQRRGLDLHTNVSLSLKEALLGFEKSIEHLDGHQVRLSRSGVTQHHHVESVANEGMPKLHVPSEKGVLHVTYHVEFPSHLTDEQLKVVKDFL